MKIDYKEVEILNEVFSGFAPEFLKQIPCRIKPEEVINKINNNEKIVIIDIRTDKEERFVGFTTPNSLHIPLEKLFTKEGIDKLLEYNDYEIVLSCYTGSRSLIATAFLQRIGLKNVKSLEGGIVHFAMNIKP